MRLIGRSLAGVILLLALLWVFQAIGSLLPARQATPAHAQAGTRETVFVLSRDHWTEFAVPPQTELLRVSAVAAASPELSPDADQAFAIEFINVPIGQRNGELESYHFRSRLPKPEQPQLHRSDPKDRLLRQRSFFVDPVAATADRLRLRLAPSPSAPWLAVRVDAKIGRGSDETRLLWSRLRGSVRSELARASIAPLNLLSRDELDQLLRHGWQSLGPEGISGRDYQVEFLYQRTTPGADSATKVTPAAGVLVGPQHQLSVPLLKTTALTLQADATAASLRLLLLDDKGAVLLEQTIKPIADLIRWRGQLEPGLLVLSATEPVHLRLIEQDSPLELNFGQLPTYLVDQDVSVTYTVQRNISAVVRVDLRGVVQRGEQLTNYQGPVVYRWLSDQNEEIGRGELALNVAWSNFDRLVSIQSLDRVSERARQFLVAPDGADRLQLSAAGRSLVNVANRPPSLVWTRPTDGLERIVPAPAWFSFYPDNEATLVATGRRLLLRGQQRPVMFPDSSKLIDRYEWQPLEPNQRRPSQLVVAPSIGAPSGASATAFHPLLRGENLIVLDPQRKSLRPRLLFLRDQDTPTELHLSWHGGELRRTIAGRTGQIELPSLTGGRLAVWLEADDGRYWINQVESDGAFWRQRRVYALQKAPLEFVISKTGNEREVINIETYVHESGESPSLRVTARLPARSGVLADYTITEREFQLASPELLGRDGRVLFTDGERVTRAQRGAFVISSDVPAGQYVLRLAWTSAIDGYVAVYQLQGGAQIISRYFTEEVSE